MTSQEISTIAERARPIFEKYDISYAGLFGSYARGEERPDSDIDILVRFVKTPSLLTVISAEQKLQSIFGKKVDLVTEGALSPFLRDEIIASLVPLYENR